MSLRMLIIVAIVVIAAIALPATASAQAPTTGDWTLTTADGSYAGWCSTDFESFRSTCHGSLVSGSPESSVIPSGNCVLVLAPSGTANMSCRPLRG